MKNGCNDEMIWNNRWKNKIYLLKVTHLCLSRLTLGSYKKCIKNLH